MPARIFIALVLISLFGCAQKPVDGEPNEGAEMNEKVEREFADFGLRTNTAKSSIDLSDVISGGPGKDGIPAIRNPKFTSVGDADQSIRKGTMGIVIGNETKRFYPYNILNWHEIANDVVDGESVAVTFCPLCGSALVFSRRLGNETLEFGVSGLLYQSNLLMYDKGTESLWSQVRGEAVVGEHTGKKLTLMESQIMNFSEFSGRYPDGFVLSTDTGYVRSYDFDPYGDYETTSEIYFPLGDYPEELPPKEIVFVVRVNDTVALFPIEQLRGQSAQLSIGGKQVIAVADESGVRATVDGKRTPGYYAMYFSVATQEKNVVIWKKGNGVNAPDEKT